MRDSMDDNDLIRKTAEGDAGAFKTLVDRHQGLVINACYHILGNREDAEDVAQEVFFQVYRSARSFRQQSKLSTWLYRVSVNRSLNFIRDNRRFRWLKKVGTSSSDLSEGKTDPPAPESDRPDAALEKRERREIIRRALASLPEKQRAAFVLHKYEGLPYKEIAEIMERSLSSVESLIHRAKLNLQKKIFRQLGKK